MPTKTLKQSGAQSATWLVTGLESPGVPFGPADWAQLSGGPLKDFLSRQYGNRAGFFAAAAEAGFSASTIGSYLSAYNQTDMIVDFDGPVTGYLFLQYADPETASMTVTLSVVYSVEA